MVVIVAHVGLFVVSDGVFDLPPQMSEHYWTPQSNVSNETSTGKTFQRTISAQVRLPFLFCVALNPTGRIFSAFLRSHGLRDERCRLKMRRG